MRAVRISLISVGVLLTAFVIGVVLLFTMDLGRFKPQVENLISDQLGRGAHIDGIFQPTLGAEIRVIAEEIWIENPDWAAQESLIRVQRLDVSVDTWELLSGRILLTNLEVGDIALGLEQDETGSNNWTFPQGEEEAEEEPDDAGSGLNLLIRQARIRDLTITHVDPSRDAPIRFHANTIDQVELESGDLQLDLDGDINGTQVTLGGTAGSFANLIAAGEVHYELHGAIGDISIDSNAQIDNLAEPRKPVGQLTISGPDAKYLTDVLGIAPITQGPLNLHATIEPVAEKMNLEIQGDFGEFEIDVVGSFSDLQSVDDVNIEFGAAGPDAATFGRLTGIDGIPADPYSIRGTLRGEGETAIAGTLAIGIGETEFDVKATIAEISSIDGAVVSLQINGPQFGRFNKLLGLPGKLTGPFSLTADLSQSAEGEELVDISAQARDIEFRVNGIVSTEPDFVGTELALSVKGNDLSVIAGALDMPDVPGMPFDVTASVSRAERGFAIDRGVVNLGDNVIRVDGLVGNELLERDTDLRFKVSGPDLSRTLTMVGVELDALPPGSYEVAGRIRPTAEQFKLDDITARLGNTRARLSGQLGNLPDLQGTDIDITVEGDSLANLVPEVSDYAFQKVPFNVASNIRVARDVLKLGDLKVELGAGRLRGDISIAMSPMLASGSVEITANGPDVAKWVPSFAQYVPVTAPFDLSAGVHWQDTHIVVDRLVLKIADGQLAVNGAVDGTDFSRTDMNIDAQLASMSNLGRLAGRDLPDEPLSLSAHLIGSADAIRLEDLVATTGKSDLSGGATYQSQGDIPVVEINLRSRYLNLAPLLPPLEDDATSEPAPPADDSRVIPDTPIPMDLLQQLNARVDISIGELVLRESTVTDVVLDGSLQSGAMRVDKFGLAGQRGTLSGTLELLPTAGEPRISAAIDGAGMTLGLTPTGPDALSLLPNYDIQLKLAADGATVRDMAASLDATLRLTGGSGQTKGMPGWFMRDVTAEVMDTVNPFSKKDGFTRIQCFAVLLRSVAGEVDGVPALVVQTDKLNIIGVAFVDLGTEAIDVKIETAARKGIGISIADFVTPYTKIGGTLASPHLAFDEKEAISRGAETVMTLGTSWVAKKVKNRFFSPEDPCGAAVLEADEEMKNVGND